MDLDVSLFPDKQCRLILIGKTGNGKSSTGNSILGRRAFRTFVGVASGTKYGDLQSVLRGDVELQVMDTPGLHDTEVSDDIIADRITRSLLAIHPGPHAIILCLSCNKRFTPEEVQVFDALKDLFGERMVRHLIIVLVDRDVLEKAHIRFEDQLRKCVELQKVLSQAGNRYVLFDNRPELGEREKTKQVDELLTKVTEVIELNNRMHFRHNLSTELDDAMACLAKAELEKVVDSQKVEDLYRQDLQVPGKRRAAPVAPPARQTQDSQPTPSEDAKAMQGAKTVGQMIDLFQAMDSDTGAPGGTKSQPAPFVYTVPDKPNVQRREKALMVDRVLKKQIASGSTRLSREQVEIIKKMDKSFLQKMQDSMKKFAVKTMGICRLM